MKIGDRVKRKSDGALGTVERVSDDLEPVEPGVSADAADVAVPPDLVRQMVGVLRRIVYDGGQPVNATEAAEILAALHPVDPVVLRARELVAAELDADGASTAAAFRDGKRDASAAMRAVVRALREGLS